MARAGSRRAAPKDDSPTKKYVIAPGHTLTMRVPDEESGEMVDDVLEPGAEVELTERQAIQCGAAVELPGSRTRGDGQTRRLQRENERLRAENARLRAAAKKPTAEDKKRLEEASESVRARGDNFIGRGEPAIGQVPPDVVEAFDNQVVPSGDGESAEELSGGMKGLDRETSGTSRDERGATNRPGESQRPGASTPTSAPEDKK